MMDDKSGPIGDWLPTRCDKKRITPKQAKTILDNHNTKNRNPVRSTIEHIADDITNGKWECNGETIIFSANGTLVDGQNRLFACVKADKPIQSWIAFGVSDEAFYTIDRGHNRNVASDLQIKKENNSIALAAALQIIAAYQDGFRNIKLVNSLYDSRVIQTVLDRNPSVRNSVAWASTNRVKVQCPQRVLTAVHYLAGLSGNPKVVAKRDEFFDRLVTGANLPINDPVLTLRNKLVSMSSNPESRIRKGMGRIAAITYLHSIVKAWNAYLMGHALGKIQLTYTDNERNVLADIPEIRTYFRKSSITNTTHDVDAIEA